MDSDEVEPVVEETASNSLRLSSSQLSTYEQCPRKWKHRYIDKIYGDPTAAMVMGTFVHAIFEDLFVLPKDERTEDQAKVIAREQWEKLEEDSDFTQFGLDEKEQKDFRVKSWNLVRRLWDLENPQFVDVVDVEMKVEFEVCEGVSMIGFIDRLSSSNGKIDIIDYKTGKRPRKNYEDDKVRQIYLYGLAVSKLMDTEVGKGKLLFLGGNDPGIVMRSITPKIIDETERHLIEDALEIVAAKKSDVHEANTGPLCGWCDFFPYCSEGQEYVMGRLEQGNFRKDAPAVLMMKDDALIESIRALDAANRNT